MSRGNHEDFASLVDELTSLDQETETLLTSYPQMDCENFPSYLKIEARRREILGETASVSATSFAELRSKARILETVLKSNIAGGSKTDDFDQIIASLIEDLLNEKLLVNDRLAESYRDIELLILEVATLMDVLETIYFRVSRGDGECYPIPEIKERYSVLLKNQKILFMSKREDRALDYAIMELDNQIGKLKDFYQQRHGEAHSRVAEAPPSAV